MTVHVARRRYNPMTGQVEEYLFDDQTGALNIRKSQRVTRQLKWNHENRAETPHSHLRTDGVFRAGRIPVTELERMLREDGVNFLQLDHKEKRDYLNKNPQFKVRQGKL